MKHQRLFAILLSLTMFGQSFPLPVQAEMNQDSQEESGMEDAEPLPEDTAEQEEDASSLQAEDTSVDESSQDSVEMNHNEMQTEETEQRSQTEPVEKPEADNSNLDQDGQDEDEVIVEIQPDEYIDIDWGEDMDDESLYETYVDKLFYGSDAAASTTSAARRAYGRNRFTGANLGFYTFLKGEWTSVANGEEESAVFTMKVSDLGIQTTYTAAELGISTTVSGGAMTSEAKTALRSKLNYNFATVFNGLLADCPYQAYWLDKTTGCSFSPGSYSASPTKNTISWTGTLSFTFKVSNDYKGNSDHTVNLTKTSAAVTAVANAKNIVNKYASASDTDKLKGYANSICSMVSYNSAAASSSYTGGYGNPWQIVYVFDNNPNTSVVCEGYAKAFQYLCDLSSWNKDIQCFSVTGRFISSNTNGGHMWNLVSIDGQNYLVDLTNDDKGTSCRGDLFLKLPASGSLESGYVYSTSAGSYTYIYSAEAVDYFGASMLAMENVPQAVNGVSLNAYSMSLSAGESKSLTATIIPSDAADKTVSWSSSDASVASVDSTGKVTGKTAGKAVITVKTKDGGYTAQCTVTVTVPSVAVMSIALKSPSLTLSTGSTAVLTGTISPSDASNKTVYWSSSNTKVATVDGTGKVTGISAGTAVITVRTADGSKTSTCNVTVVNKTVAVTGVCLSKSSLALTIGDTGSLTASATPSNASNQAVIWTSSNSNVASVDSSGKVTARNIGTAKITVTTKDGNKSAVCTVTVSAKRQTMYRLYNPNSGEHFYTASTKERDSLSKVGWKYEGVAWTAPSISNTPVYRLYNSNAGDHHYTTSAAERDALVKAGWKYEGIGWYSDDAKGTSLYRLYNPNAKAGAHHYTTSANERDSLKKAGWKDEGIGWYGLK